MRTFFSTGYMNISRIGVRARFLNFINIKREKMSGKMSNFAISFHFDATQTQRKDRIL
jgi:hypothetical protein